MRFFVEGGDGTARTGVLETARGLIHTPAFMPVGTGGTVKAMYMDQVRGVGADIILGNTYHLMLRPGAERVARLGGLHEFARWPWPILTDSGGFQVMSLSKLRKLTENGVTFRSHIDGTMFELSPERSIEIQALLGADISMQMDECLKVPATREEIQRHQLEHRIEAHILISFLAYCLHVTLRRRLRDLAPGLTARAVLEKFTPIQMLDVHLPTTDQRTVILTRYTQPETDVRLLLERLKLELPPQPPPKITSSQPRANQPL